MLYPLRKNCEKPYGVVAFTPPPPFLVRPRINVINWPLYAYSIQSTPYDPKALFIPRNPCPG